MVEVHCRMLLCTPRYYQVNAPFTLMRSTPQVYTIVHRAADQYHLVVETLCHVVPTERALAHFASLL